MSQTKNKTTLAQLKLIFGMSYVVHTADGRFIIIDGGMKTAAHTQGLLDYLAKKAEGKKPVIACWMFTHLDGDHVDNAFDILLNHSNDLELQCMGIAFPEIVDFEPREDDHPTHQQWMRGAMDIQRYSETRFEKIKELYPNTEFWDLQCDDKRQIDDVKIHVLMTPHERIPDHVMTHNARNAVFKLTFTQGTDDPSDDTTFLAMDDNSGGGRNEFILDRYPKEVIKSDVLQVIHHGMYGGHLDLYQEADPAICFWPTTEARFCGYEVDRDGNPVSYNRLTLDLDFNAYLRDDSVRVRTHFHGEQNVEIDMSDLSTVLFD